MNSTDNHTQKNTDKLFESLFEHAASRPKPPADDETRIREQLHAQWQAITNKRRRRRWVTGLAVAASVVVVSFVSISVFNQSTGPIPSTELASVDKVDGRVTAALSSGAVLTVEFDRSLQSGSLLTTAYGARVALRWNGGESIRLDENSRLRLISDSEVELINGRVYIDSHADMQKGIEGDSLAIKTAFGTVRHIGTQYITSLTREQVAVTVRRGSVLVMDNGHETIAKSGQQLSISSDGEIAYTPIKSYGENWLWVQEISPDFNLDARSVADFLNWVSNESGHPLSYGSAVAESLAADTVMHGTVNLQPMRALELMLETSDLVANVENGIIMVNIQ